MNETCKLDECPCALSDFHKVELEQLSASLMAAHTTRANVAVFFGTVNLAAMAFAIEWNNPLIAILAGLFLLIYPVFEVVARGHVIATYFRLYQLYKRYCVADQFLQANYPKNVSRQDFEDIAKEAVEQPDNIVTALRKRRWDWKGIRKSLKSQAFTGFYAAIIISVVEILSGSIAWWCRLNLFTP